MKSTIALLQREFSLEIRQSYALFGVVLYILSTVYVCYLSFNTLDQGATWNALLWIIVLFSSFNAVGRSFASETRGKNLYTYTLAHPQQIIVAKLIYNALTMIFLGILTLGFYLVFLGPSVLERADVAQFVVVYTLGTVAFASALTLISAIASAASNNSGLMALLGFPVVIPFLIVMIDSTSKALNQMPWSENAMNLLLLGGIMTLASMLSVVLFPYIWRD